MLTRVHSLDLEHNLLVHYYLLLARGLSVRAPFHFFEIELVGIFNGECYDVSVEPAM